MTTAVSAPDYSTLVADQRTYFMSGKTRPVEWRIAQLKALRAMIDENREAMYDALWTDLRRNKVDADLMDVDFNIREVDHALKNLHHWMEPEHVATPLLFEPGRLRVRHDPLGVTLIIGAWNEPFMLTLGPLVPAIAAGNTAVIKPSEIAAASAAVLADLVPRYLDRAAVAVVEGAVPETTALLDQHWDFIFFTGSPGVGKIVHQAAAKHLTPAVLELGGKNPVIVHPSADLKSAARRIAYGRFINSGHICTAPDHVLVWPEVKEEFVGHLKDAIRDFYGDDPKTSPDYGRIINDRNFQRIAGFLTSGTIVAGGQTDASERYIAPTVLVDVSPDSPIMQDEVFGSILPILDVDSVEAAIDWVNGHPRPLGLYIFAEDQDVIERILDSTSSGNADINDCAVHPLLKDLPFGGVGNSGIGKYHGRWGYEAFTNTRGVLYHGPKIDPGVKYPPYGDHALATKVLGDLM